VDESCSYSLRTASVSASGLRKPRLLAAINAPDPHDRKSRKLLERLEDKNTKLRVRVVELFQQIRALSALSDHQSGLRNSLPVAQPVFKAFRVS